MEHEITLSAAAAMTSRYRSNRESILEENRRNSDVLPLCETFAKESVIALLNEQGAAKLRIYYGMNADLKVHAILVAADSDGADILPSTTNTSNSALEDDPIVILEDAQRCPPYCPPASTLNEDDN